jgi:hypothetical protein
MSTRNIHPSVKVRTVTVPVNAPTASAAVRACREVLAANHRTLVDVVVAKVTANVPEAQAAITYPGSTQCFFLRVEYTVNS